MTRRHHLLACLALATAFLPSAAFALTVSPPSFPDLAANPGDTIARVLRVQNDAAAPVRVQAEAVNFAGVPGDETRGTPDFYPVGEIRNGRELAGWLRMTSPELILPPGEAADIGFEIRVPEDAAPGGYFGAVLLTMTAPDEPGVTVAARTATLILLRVHGEIREEAVLRSFAPDRLVADGLPIAFETRVENTGTVHVRPVGTITIRDLFGRVAAEFEVNRLEGKSVLPGGTRRFEISWLRDPGPYRSELDRAIRNFAIGRYTAELRLAYGEEGKTLQADAAFWVLPWRLLAAGAVILIAMLLFMKWLLARHQKSVIARYEASKKEQS